MPEGIEVWIMLQSIRKMLGRKISKIISVERYKEAFNEPYTRKPILLETEFELAGWKDFILSNAAQRGKHIVLEFTEANTKKTCCVRWSLGLGALFCLATDEQVTKYPFCYYGTQQARANYCFSFVPTTGSPSYLIILDCLNLQNNVTWVLFFNREIAEDDVWEKYKHLCAFSDTDRWMDIVTKTDIEPYDGWSNARILKERKLFHGVGKYLTSEILAHLAILTNEKVAPWSVVTKDSLRQMAVILKNMALNAQNEWKNKEIDVTEYPAKKIESFMKHWLIAFGKKSSFVWSYKQRDSKADPKIVFSKIKNGTEFPKDELWILVPTQKVHWKSFLSKTHLGIGPLWWNVPSEISKLGTTTGPAIFGLQAMESSKEEVVIANEATETVNTLTNSIQDGKKQRRHFRSHPKNNPQFKRKARPNPLTRHKNKLKQKIQLEDSQGNKEFSCN